MCFVLSMFVLYSSNIPRTKVKPHKRVKIDDQVWLCCITWHGVMVIVVGNGHGDTSSNPG